MIEDDLGPLEAASQRALDWLRQAEEEQQATRSSRLVMVYVWPAHLPVRRFPAT